MAAERTLRVFLADDHAVVREGLKALIDAQPDMQVIGEAHDGEQAWKALGACAPDVAVLDISMPALSGAQLTQRLRESCPQLRVLALSVHEDKSYLRELLDAGASGYALKRSAAEVLIRAIRTVGAGASTWTRRSRARSWAASSGSSP